MHAPPLTPTQPISDLLEKAHQSVQGWSPLDQLLCLFSLSVSSAHLGGDLLEIGSWCGRSAVALALAAKLSPRTKVHCVDLFPEKKDWFPNSDGTYSFTVSVKDRTIEAYHVQTVWDEPYQKHIMPLYDKHSGILEIFLENVNRFGLKEFVRPFKGDSSLLAEELSPNQKFRMAFIDGDHSYDAVKKDLKNIEPHLLSGAWVCFDDAFTSYEGVDQAIQELVIDSNRYHRYQQMTRKLFVAQLK
jgi:predicted O-methyltransferase YrrM